MKYDIEVTITKTITIELNEDINWDEMVSEFNSYMYGVDDVEHLVEYMARVISTEGYCTFIEGIGSVDTISDQRDNEANAWYQIEDTWFDADVRKVE